MEFPLSARRREGSHELVDISGPGFRATVCAHGARALAAQLIEAADAQHCDGYRHGGEETMYLGVQIDAGSREAPR